MDQGTSKKKVSARADDGQSFEKSLARLEQIVEQLDEGNLPLARAIALFKEGTELAKLCRAMLAEADVQIKEALQANEDDEAAEGDEIDERGESDAEGA